MKRKKGHFSISAVAQMFSVHHQTIRMYEKQGLINPKRSEGNTRLFSESDIDRLELIIHLTHSLGINLAGVEMVLKLKKQVATLKKQMNDMFQRMDQELEQEKTDLHKNARTYAKKITEMRQLPSPESEKTDNKNQQTLAMEDWEVDYEDE